ncbi:MAG: hypothetical protein KGQ41_06840 [Alphaproteobacteria bacterium]|nr:hypothetical protein [Alphaproteobacteria bacterium]
MAGQKHSLGMMTGTLTKWDVLGKPRMGLAYGALHVGYGRYEILKIHSIYQHDGQCHRYQEPHEPRAALTYNATLIRLETLEEELAQRAMANRERQTLETSDALNGGYHYSLCFPEAQTTRQRITLRLKQRFDGAVRAIRPYPRVIMTSHLIDGCAPYKNVRGYYMAEKVGRNSYSVSYRRELDPAAYFEPNLPSVPPPMIIGGLIPFRDALTLIGKYEAGQFRQWRVNTTRWSVDKKAGNIGRLLELYAPLSTLLLPPAGSRGTPL